jgi:polyisoprenoid-binding protein YceI
VALHTYVLDADISRLTVRGFAGGMLSVMGHNPVVAVRDLSGEAQYDPESPETGTLHLTAPAASLEVQNDASDKDKREMTRTMREEVLEVATYPEIALDSERISVKGSRLEIVGNLSLHGVTRPVSIPAYVSLLGDTLRANGEFSILQTDFRIKLVSVAGGTLKLKDELKLSFDVVGRRKP